MSYSVVKKKSKKKKKDILKIHSSDKRYSYLPISITKTPWWGKVLTAEI